MEVKRYFERKVSLLSTSDVRYDGELYTVDPAEQSIALKHVNCMGTEGRRSGDQAIAPSDCTYEFIIFRAVNIRELWLIEENGMRRSLNQEVLMPLRTGQTSHQYGAVKRADDHYEEVPKRKVGYQTRNMGGAYQNYGYQPPQQASYPGYSSMAGGYPPQYEQESYPPLPNAQSARAYYAQRQYEPRQPPYYPQRQAPYQQTQYRQQRYNQQYYQQGYQQPRYQRQYANQGGYYMYGGNQNYYNNNNPRNQNYRRNTNKEYYNNNSNQRRNNPRRNRPQTRSGKAGTGAFLDRRLQGDDIDIENAHDFDFGAALAEFDDSPEANGASPDHAQDDQDDAAHHESNDGDHDESHPEHNDDGNDDGAINNVNDGGDGGGGDDDEKVEKDKKYDKTKSFFDGLMTETKKNKPKINVSAAKNTDSKTFGSVATAYKSRHITRSGSRRTQRNYNNSSNNNYNNNYNNNRTGNNYNNNGGGQSQRTYYGSNRWVRR